MCFEAEPSQTETLSALSQSGNTDLLPFHLSAQLNIMDLTPELYLPL